MKYFARTALIPMLAALTLSSVGGVVRADAILFERGLPDTNLNSSAGANRSNVSWAEADPQYFTGDDFTLASGTWVINSLTIWTPIIRTGSAETIASYNPNGITLYGGKNGVVALESSGAITGNTAANPDVEFTKVNYPDAGATSFYEGNGHISYELWEVTFNNLNWTVQGGEVYQFGVNGPDGFWFNHASNAALSGTTQTGANDQYLIFDMSNLAAGGSVFDSNGNGWDKSSDINVRISGAAVPLPSSAGMGLILLGAVGAAGLLRKKLQTA